MIPEDTIEAVTDVPRRTTSRPAIRRSTRPS